MPKEKRDQSLYYLEVINQDGESIEIQSDSVWEIAKAYHIAECDPTVLGVKLERGDTLLEHIV